MDLQLDGGRKGSDPVNGYVERQKVADELLDMRNFITNVVDPDSDCSWTVDSCVEAIDDLLEGLKTL